MIGENGLKLIKKFEGFSPLEYTCVGGKKTIGYGHVVLPGESFPCGVTENKALEILSADVSIAEKTVLDLVRVPLNRNQFDALVSFVFNLGRRNFEHSTLLKRLNDGAYDDCPAEIMRWVYVGGTVNAGLMRRRKAEACLFKKNVIERT